MSRIHLAAVAVFALVGCAADSGDSIPDGLVVSQRTPALVGTFGGNGDGLRFDFSDQRGTHEAILTDVHGAQLEDVVFVDGGIDGASFVEAILLERTSVIGVPGQPEREPNGDPSVLADLAARPEMQLVAPLEAALSDAGTETPATTTPLMPTQPSVDLYVTDGSTWSWSTIFLGNAP